MKVDTIHCDRGRLKSKRGPSAAYFFEEARGGVGQEHVGDFVNSAIWSAMGTHGLMAGFGFRCVHGCLERGTVAPLSDGGFCRGRSLGDLRAESEALGEQTRLALAQLLQPGTR